MFKPWIFELSEENFNGQLTSDPDYVLQWPDSLICFDVSFKLQFLWMC